MKIYRISYSIAEDDGTVVSYQNFEASDGAASKRGTAIKTEFKDQLDDKPVREAIDVPTNKADLIEWLNKNATVAKVVMP